MATALRRSWGMKARGSKWMWVGWLVEGWLELVEEDR